jgi:serine/threonine protein phosphatase PrpC
VKIAGRTDTGIVRTRNEDAFACNEQAGLLVVADGVGGQSGGQTAASLAVSVFREGFKNRPAWDHRDPDEEAEFLEFLLDKANRAIYKIASKPSAPDMATTLVALSAARRSVAVLHVGDSRAYLYRRARLKRITSDHSIAESKKVFGIFSRSEEARRRDPMRHMVLRALGQNPEVRCDVRKVRRKPGDVFLLCTDGLSDYVSEKDIAWTLGDKGEDLQAACDALVSLANRSGGHDNITAGLIRF